MLPWIAADLDRYMASIALDLEKKYQRLYADYEQELASMLERESCRKYR